MGSVLQHIRVERVMTDQAAGTGDTLTSDTVDMQGYDEVLFACSFGPIVAGATTTFKLQGSDDNSSWSDLSGVTDSIADTDDDKTAILILTNPLMRYVRGAVVRATQNSTIDSMVAYQAGGLKKPPTHATDVVDGGVFNGADEA